MNQPIRNTKIGRNDPCPCGSGKKFKKCCASKTDQGTRPYHPDKPRIRLKSSLEIEAIRRAGRLVVDTLDMVESHLAPGITTEEINTLVHTYTLQHGAKPAPLNYRGFPKSVCVSVNEVICHGIPGPRVLQDGDIVNVDVTSILNGYYADANKSYFIGTPGPEARKIVDVASQSLKQGMDMVKPGNTIGDIGHVTTTILAAVFFINCLLIASPLVLHVSRKAPDSVVEQIRQQEAQQKAAQQEKTAASLEKQKGAATDLPEITPTPAAGSPAAENPVAEMSDTGKPAAPAAAPETSLTPDKNSEDLPE